MTQALIDAGNAPGAALREEIETESVDQLALELGENVLERSASVRGVALSHPVAVTGGRRPGAKNRVTRELVDVLFHKLGHKDPLVAAAEIVSGGWDALAETLECSRKDAFDRWDSVRRWLADYVHQRQPIAVDAKGVPAVPMFIGVAINQNETPANSMGYMPVPEEVAQAESRTDAPSD